MMNSRKRPLTGLLRLRPREWADLAMAQVALLRAELDIRRRPKGSLVTVSRQGSPPYGSRPASRAGPKAAAPASDLDRTCDRLAWAVQAAARHGPFRHGCLVRALALQRLLAQRGIRGSTVRVGVRRDGNRFTAHAWVEYRNAVLGDSVMQVRSFAELDDLNLIA